MNKISLSEFNDLLKLETEEDNNEQCLISHDILIEDNITLECGHKFNYLPLLNEVKYQKLNNNPLEYKKLKINELKCPYCRNIQINYYHVIVKKYMVLIVLKNIV